MRFSSVALFLCALLPVACSSVDPPPNDDVEQMQQELRVGASNVVVGRIRYGETSRTIAYRSPPLYRALAFSGGAGDNVESLVKSTGAVEAWIVDNHFNVIAHGESDGRRDHDARVTATLRRTSDHYIVFRDAKLRPASFVISLARRAPIPADAGQGIPTDAGVGDSGPIPSDAGPEGDPDGGPFPIDAGPDGNEGGPFPIDAGPDGDALPIDGGPDADDGGPIPIDAGPDGEPFPVDAGPDVEDGGQGIPEDGGFDAGSNTATCSYSEERLSSAASCDYWGAVRPAYTDSFSTISEVVFSTGGGMLDRGMRFNSQAATDYTLRTSAVPSSRPYLFEGTGGSWYSAIDQNGPLYIGSISGSRYGLTFNVTGSITSYDGCIRVTSKCVGSAYNPLMR